MTRKPVLIVLAVSVVINLVAIFTFGFFWREQLVPRRHRPMLPPPAAEDRAAQLDRIQDRFRLSSVQMDSIRILDQVMRTTMRPVNDTLERRQEQLLALLTARTIDWAEVDRLSHEVLALRAGLETRSLELMVRMAGILTPEQRKDLGEIFVAFRAPAQRPAPGSARPNGPPGDDAGRERP